jgi:2-pyrone-4,6-dicarboxylate lactonase
MTEAGLPAGAVDAHAHVLGEGGTVDGAAYQPFAASAEGFVAHLDALGFQRGVLVNASIYGDDNTHLLAALRAYPDRLRGVAVVPSTVDDAVLDELHEAGVRGCRVQDRFAGGTPVTDLPALLPRIAERGWHVQVWTDIREHEDLLRSAAESGIAPIVLDHFGFVPAGEDGTKPVLDLLSAGPCWVKLSGSYRLAPGLTEPEAARLMRARVDAVLEKAPNRALWASDWPYVAPPGPVPTDEDHADVLATWFGGEELRERVLVQNPRVIYDW